MGERGWLDLVFWIKKITIFLEKCVKINRFFVKQTTNFKKRPHKLLETLKHFYQKTRSNG